MRLIFFVFLLFKIKGLTKLWTELIPFLAFTVKTNPKSKPGPLSKLFNEVDDFMVTGNGPLRSMVPPMDSNGVKNIQRKLIQKLPKYFSM